jgi:thermostable 8-oxoguanine DNA glycosylase
MSYTKKFDFRRQLKDMTLEELKSFREKHVDYMLDFSGLDNREADRYLRYVGYIDRAIEKRQS